MFKLMGYAGVISMTLFVTGCTVDDAVVYDDTPAYTTTYASYYGWDEQPYYYPAYGGLYVGNYYGNRGYWGGHHGYWGGHRGWGGHGGGFHGGHGRR